MKLIKVFGLAVVAVLALTAFVGVGTASAVPDEVVLCKKLIANDKLCLKGELVEVGATIKALASSPELTAGAFSKVKCEDSTMVGKVTSSIPLKGSITALEFGKLPTPSLGTGCTTCTSGVHTTVPIAIEPLMPTATTYTLMATGEAELLNCFGLGINCKYRGENLEPPIDHGGTHSPSEAAAFAVVLINVTLNRVAPSSGFCPATGTWTANYSIYDCEEGGNHIPCWLALDVK